MSEPDVTFTVEITSAEGAKIAQASVPVTIVDDGGLWLADSSVPLCRYSSVPHGAVTHASLAP